MRGALLLSLAGLSLALPTNIPGKNAVPGHPLHNANRLAVPDNLNDEIANPIAKPVVPINAVNNAANAAGRGRRAEGQPLAGVAPTVDDATHVANNAGDAVNAANTLLGKRGGAIQVPGQGDRDEIPNSVGKPVVPGTKAVHAVDLDDPTNPFNVPGNAASDAVGKRGDTADGNAAGSAAGDAAGKAVDGATGAAAGAAEGNAAGGVGGVTGAVPHKRGDIAQGAAAGSAAGSAAGKVGDVLGRVGKRSDIAQGAAAGTAAGGAAGKVGNVAGDVLH
ncbi:uncharacterized protein C8A04DRAFT_29623 [Dichotomopilus funicola]|uniref:Uncharacterized protein n=1 Tax=Dichotomopilus funicola TaxID=1934379 RepID=A0AAN6ZMH9_9PEZI|nr:hypothetical protein C8A04DRAFT_29623 [Dichotomopilus funicola]